MFSVVVNYRLHSAARRAEALGWRYEAHRRGLEMCSINLPTTISPCLGCIPILIVERVIPESQATRESRNQIEKLLLRFGDNDEHYFPCVPYPGKQDMQPHPCPCARRSISSASSAVRGTMLETWMYSRGLWSNPPIGARPSSTGRPMLAR